MTDGVRRPWGSALGGQCEGKGACVLESSLSSDGVWPGLQARRVALSVKASIYGSDWHPSRIHLLKQMPSDLPIEMPRTPLKASEVRDACDVGRAHAGHVHDGAAAAAF